ncbi:hypothetical protein BDK51DRAFT_45808 [Blyttiomyces helicus]|uniref:Uncharacterized protein n=1 Tax=Blyttiomyces helicus TaxID=388810 RepID=A0A4P9WI56_9FUNG|nr:hypothetical protein BDK51DRAFT_45808 [Blyttiomyces helicus]|eukprot:RKO90236.1 hypothetical protein BDK51DRAFT_45808 [Blyttiomyces helicus]
MSSLCQSRKVLARTATSLQRVISQEIQETLKAQLCAAGSGGLVAVDMQHSAMQNRGPPAGAPGERAFATQDIVGGKEDRVVDGECGRITQDATEGLADDSLSSRWAQMGAGWDERQVLGAQHVTEVVKVGACTVRRADGRVEVGFDHQQAYFSVAWLVCCMAAKELRRRTGWRKRCLGCAAGSEELVMASSVTVGERDEKAGAEGSGYALPASNWHRIGPHPAGVVRRAMLGLLAEAAGGETGSDGASHFGEDIVGAEVCKDVARAEVAMLVMVLK